MTHNRPSLMALLYHAGRQGILPLTSRCNVRCVFCSHRFNPPGVEVYPLPDLPLEQAMEAVDWLPGEGKIVIGEATTRIKEGEPFLYPELWPVLERVRRIRPNATIQMTTNGSLLTSERVKRLEELDIELVVSLNSSNPAMRQLVMEEADGEKAPQAVARLGVSKVPFEGSIVAMPQITGYDDIHETAVFLAGNGARCIRIFEPGFTRFTPGSLLPPEGTRGRLEELCHKLSGTCRVPVILEPGLPGDLQPVVKGVVPGSSAAGAGLLEGDCIKSIDGQLPFSRVQAFRLLGEKASLVELSRGKVLNWKPAYRDGVIMDYDLAWEDIQEIGEVIEAHGGEHPLIITSLRAGPVLGLGLEKVECKATLLPVTPGFFGGSIACCGLLTLKDIYEALRSLPAPHDLVLLPRRTFDDWGRDLVGEDYRYLERELGIPCRIVGHR